MKLAIISDCHHYKDHNGVICSLGPVVKQFDMWAGLFDEVIVCAPLLDASPPAAYRSTYSAGNIRLLSVKNAGGNTLAAKLNLLAVSIDWWKILRGLLHEVDAVHVRCPNNIGILGLLAVHHTSLLRQAVYTGTWMGYKNEPLTYKFQRYWLKHLFKGPVAVYGEWPNQPAHIVPSFSPSYSLADWAGEEGQVAERLAKLKDFQALPEPVRLMTVGALNNNKNQKTVIEAVSLLTRRGFDCTLNVFGDGENRAMLENMSLNLGLAEIVTFHGNVSQDRLREYYRASDFVVQAPVAEGFGKVPIEAFFHGVVPIMSDAGMSAQIAGNGLRGRCFSHEDPEAAASIIMDLSGNTQALADMIRAGREFARKITLESWQEHICSMLNRYWDVNLESCRKTEEIDD